MGFIEGLPGRKRIPGPPFFIFQFERKFIVSSLSMELSQANLAVVDDLTLIYVQFCSCITKAKRPSNCQLKICRN